MNAVRPITPADHEMLCRIWYRGWHEAHAALVPPSLVEARSMASFRARLGAMLDQTRTIGPEGEPAGFCTVRRDEVMHLFVASAARGTGVAIDLLHDAEARLRDRGVRTAWLACVIGNCRAARFYEREGWNYSGTISYEAETASGPFPLVEWRYEKRL